VASQEPAHPWSVAGQASRFLHRGLHGRSAGLCLKKGLREEWTIVFRTALGIPNVSGSSCIITVKQDPVKEAWPGKYRRKNEARSSPRLPKGTSAPLSFDLKKVLMIH
jgi:hypothetical protein